MCGYVAKYFVSRFISNVNVDRYIFTAVHLLHWVFIVYTYQLQLLRFSAGLFISVLYLYMTDAIHTAGCVYRPFYCIYRDESVVHDGRITEKESFHHRPIPSQTSVDVHYRMYFITGIFYFCHMKKISVRLCVCVCLSGCQKLIISSLHHILHSPGGLDPFRHVRLSVRIRVSVRGFLPI